jgi:hypothetical protein
MPEMLDRLSNVIGCGTVEPMSTVMETAIHLSLNRSCGLPLPQRNTRGDGRVGANRKPYVKGYE